MPPNISEARGLTVHVSLFVDTSLEGEKLNRRSQTENLMLANEAPTHWLIKRQPRDEASTFGAEFCIVKTEVEIVEALRCELRVLRIDMGILESIFYDNEADHESTSTRKRVVTKNHYNIACRRHKELVEVLTVKISKEGTIKKLADLITKLMTEVKRISLLDLFTRYAMISCPGRFSWRLQVLVKRSDGFSV